MAKTQTSTVLDQHGKPFKMTTLTSPQATPTTSGVRSVWGGAVASGLDPAKLATLLKAANDGDNRDFLTLAEEMEERDTHYASVLGQRKRAVSGIEPIVTPASDSAQDQEIADAVAAIVTDPDFADVVDDLLDGLAKGYSCVEMNWQMDAKRWTPDEFIWRDPRHFQFDSLTGRELRIRDDDHEDGLAMNAYGWLIHRPKLKSGLTVRGGLARLAAWCFMLKSYTLQDWAAFLEVFGMPLRVGRYDDAASNEEKSVLLRAVRDLAADAAAIIPKGMEIEFINASGGSGNAVFGSMAEYLDKQMSKGIIGQTMTVDEGASLSQSKTHDEVRDDIKKSDARQMTTTIRRGLIAPFVGLNWGWDVTPPTIKFPVDDPEDIAALTDAIGTLVPLGWRVGMADVSNRLGFRVPDDGEAVLTVPTAAAPPPPDPTRAHAVPGVCPGCGTTHRAAAQGDDPLVSAALEHWEADMTPVVSGVMALARASTGFDDFLDRLNAHSPDTSRLADRLAAQMMKARGDGIADG